MKYALGFLATLAIGASSLGCTNDYFSPSGIDVDALDRNTDPCDDFYQFSCGGWIAAHPVNDQATVAAKFFDPYYAALPILKQIIEDDAAGAQSPDDPHAALIGAYHGSCLAAPGDTASRETLSALLLKIDAVTTLDDLARQIADQRKLGSGSFFSVYVSPDLDDATRYGITLDQGGFELADRSYYLDPDQKDVLVDYTAHINSMSALIGGTSVDAQAAIRVETALAQASLPEDERRDPEKIHHPMKAAEAAALAPSFPWQTYWTQAGFTDLQQIDVAVPSYLVALEEVFSKTPLEDLKSYLRWQLLQDRSTGLDQAFIDENFDFDSKFTGQGSLPPRWFTCFNATLKALGFAVAEPYLARSSDAAAAKATSAMFARSKSAFSERLSKASWLDAPTRDEALTKLDAIVPKVGHPATGPDYSGLSFVPGSYIANEISSRAWSYERNRARLGKAVDRGEWRLTPVTVNAAYDPTVNDVTLPAALLASPFIAPDHVEAANFGALGAVLGHEMTHGFDDQGRHFDSTGTLRDWWSPEVEARFADRTQCLVDQYDAFEPVSGEHVNGALTLGENTADLGGVSIAYDAMFDGSGDLTDGDGFTAQQVFFIAYAQVFCENVRPDFQSQLLLTDPHSPGRFRVNGALENLLTFRSAFSCPAGSRMTRGSACQVW